MKSRFDACVCFMSAGLVATTAIAFSNASPGNAQTPRELKRAVKPGIETLISIHSDFGAPGQGRSVNVATCTQGPPVEVVLVAPPRNGTVALRPANEKNPACLNEIVGTGVFYTPNVGFVGADSFSYDRKGQGNPAAGVRNVTIEVKP